MMCGRTVSDIEDVEDLADQLEGLNLGRRRNVAVVRPFRHAAHAAPPRQPVRNRNQPTVLEEGESIIQCLKLS